MERHLSAILAADVAGYSRLMEKDESGAHRILQAHREDLIHPAIESHRGRIVKLMGDGTLAEFGSVVDAVTCAIEIQTGMAERNSGVPPPERMDLRIGVHLGDVIVEGADIHGDGVNIAARLESLAEPGTVCISRQAYDHVETRIDLPVEDLGEQQVKNISRPVHAYRILGEGKSATAVVRRRWPKFAGLAVGLALIATAIVAGFVLAPWREETRAWTMPSGPRIAVLPFREIGASPEDAYFADGLTRDVNALLSRFSNLFVLAPDAASRFRGNRDCEEISDALGANFLLTGTVRRAEQKLRVTTTFTDARTCRELGAPGPFDRDLSANSVLDIQLDIARKVVAQIGSSDAPLFDDEVVRDLEREAPETLTSYECVLLSYWFYENFDPDRHRRARACLENAVNTDAQYSLAWSRLAFAYIEAKKYAIDTPPDWSGRAMSAARKAIALNPENPDAYYARAILSQMMREDRSVFRTNAERAVELNPNDAFILADLGTWTAYSGQWNKGKEWVNRAMLLNPTHQSWWHFIWQLHAFAEGDYQASIDYSHKVNLAGNYMVQAALTAAYAMNGNEARAKSGLEHVLQLKPDYADDPRQPFRSRGMPKELVDGLMEGLRRAGLDVPPAQAEEPA